MTPSRQASSTAPWEIDPTRAPVLVVEDDPASLELYGKHLEGSGFQVVAARTLAEAQSALAAFRPVAVIMDILSEAESGWSLLKRIKAADTTRDMPVFVLTRVDDRMKALELGADDFCLKPVAKTWLRERLRALEKRVTLETALIVDDRERDRYLIKETWPPSGNSRSSKQTGERKPCSCAAPTSRMSFSWT